MTLLLLGMAGAEETGKDLVLIRAGETRAWFYMDAAEVTVAAFRAFDPDFAPEYFKDSNMPATGISFIQAQAYCRAANKRLPTSKEWQLACQGPGRLQYPYGNLYDPTKARVGRKAWTDGPKAVRSYTPNEFGLYDLTGNVWEWVDNGEATGEKRYIHGGAWTDGPRRTRCGVRLKKSPEIAAINYGFRCARSLTEADRVRLAEREAEAMRKAQAAGSAERARRAARVAAEEAEIAARARQALEAEAAAKRAKAAEAARKAEAFSRKTAGMVPVGLREAFYVDRHEVTVADFQAFDPSYRPGEFARGRRMPATDISFEQAVAYCRSLGKRLPTPEEWKTACRGEKSGEYSYGSRYDASQGRTGRAWYAGADTVGTGTSNDLGVSNMVGNVWEWVDGWYDSAKTLRLLHGGSWADGKETARCAGETWAKPGTRRIDAGFRCVVDRE
ncbi:MAG: SUMF1/EgtB/PvdO family nonheme iron enzyme [bacterium]|nr:SUMF1/EgtB/PvdO family nonheme iron enzyme [bacterium]